MKKIIENLANIFGTTTEDIMTKLNLNDESNSKDLAKSLGAYSVFATKEENASYINSKLANKEEMINSQKNKIEELSFQINNNLKTQEKLNELVKNEWEKLGIKRSFEKENIDISSFDFSNLKNSIINYANSEGLAMKKPDYDEFVSDQKNENEANVVVINGAVKK